MRLPRRVARGPRIRTAVVLTGLALLLAPPTLTAAPTDRLEARAHLADALYLESGMGDYRGALSLYADLADDAAVPPNVATEALFRLGLGHEVLGETDEAEAAWKRLMELHPDSGRASDARLRLDRLDQRRKRVTALPLRFGFDHDAQGLFHARSPSDRSRVGHDLADVEGTLSGVATWRTWVTGGEADRVAVGFEAGLALQGNVEVAVQCGSVPAHLVFRLVDREDVSWSSAPIVVRPEHGWVRVALTAEDFVDDAGSWTPGTDAARLEIHDITGRRSTDRGENLILLDDLVAR